MSDIVSDIGGGGKSCCTRHKLTTRQRIDLFLQVCDGVQHAHQKGIIHRDLKPSNILITIQGDRPVPKIIDFGVAKATTRSLTDRTLYTQLGVLIGTPEYMSPEQAEMTGLDIDTRTDVYALGVVLYEYQKAGRYADAENYLLAATRVLNTEADSDPFYAQGAAVNIVKQLVDLYEAWGRPDRAAPWRARLPKDGSARQAAR